MGSASKLHNLVLTIVRAIVDTPDQVKVTGELEVDLLIIDVRVDRSDMRKVIGGKSGQTARAIRLIVSAAAQKHKQRILMNFVNND